MYKMLLMTDMAHMKFRARDPKSEVSLLLWNKYVLFYEVAQVGHPTPRMGFIFCYFANRSGVVIVRC